jgi:hypothetical protein
MAILALGTACSPVSEEEVDQLKSETEGLAFELGRLRQESEILDRALTNVYREKDRVLDRLNALESGAALPAEPEAGEAVALAPIEGAEGPAPEGAPAAPRTRVAQRGDTLSQIAKDNNTTLQALLRLNPYLARRPDLMLMEEDVIVLPD